MNTDLEITLEFLDSPTEVEFYAVAGAPGQDGKDGTDGHSPVITTTKSGKVTTILSDGVSIGTVSDGSDGVDGKDGQNGTDGHSPVITTSKSGKTTTILSDGSSIGTVEDGSDGQNGQDGAPGQDGYSPSASVSKSGNTATITITDKSGTTTAEISDGQNGANGQPGADGYSPTASVSKSGNTATITITDKDGTTTATVSDGQDGQNGQDGAPGAGVASGGTTGQILQKKSGTDYDTEWRDARIKAELIANYTVAEDSASVTVNTDTNGLPFELVKAKVIVHLGASTTGSKSYYLANMNVLSDPDRIAATYGLYTLQTASATAYYFIYEFECLGGQLVFSRAYGASGYNSSSTNIGSYAENFGVDTITGFTIRQYRDNTSLIASGTTIQIYGIRA